MHNDAATPPLLIAVPDARRAGWHVIDELVVTRLVVRHGRLRALCDRLEACADALPMLPASPVLAELCGLLTGELAADLRHEQEFLQISFGHNRVGTLDRSLFGEIADRHATTSDRAHDIVAALGGGDGDLRPPSAETIGYMLRSFFESCRDALAFVELAILTLGRPRLTIAAREMLVTCLERSRR